LGLQDKPKNQNAPKRAILFVETTELLLPALPLKCATQRLPGILRLLATNLSGCCL
jgi:hypothetical protein